MTEIHLTVGQTLIEGSSDGRPSQIVWGELADPAIIAPARNDIPDHPGRERLVELQRAVVGDRLKEIGVVPITMQIAPARFIEFEILPDRRAHVFWQRQCSLSSPFDLELDDPAPVAPSNVGSPQRSDLGYAQTQTQHRQNQSMIASAFGFSFIRPSQ